MELGQRIRQARLAAGMTQRELCGDQITRNMLSLIENGGAKPSMDTLLYLSRRLGLGVDQLLGDDPLETARAAFAAGSDPGKLEDIQGPEAALLRALGALSRAEQAMGEGKLPYARQILEVMDRSILYWPLVAERYQIALARATGKPLELPPQDPVLLLRARDALDRGEPHRAGQYLDAAEDHSDPQWQLLRGQAFFGIGDYASAMEHLRQAEPHYPKKSIPLLERCCDQLEDIKGAYHYVKKLRALEE